MQNIFIPQDLRSFVNCKDHFKILFEIVTSMIVIGTKWRWRNFEKKKKLSHIFSDNLKFINRFVCIGWDQIKLK